MSFFQEASEGVFHQNEHINQDRVFEGPGNAFLNRRAGKGNPRMAGYSTEWSRKIENSKEKNRKEPWII